MPNGIQHHLSTKTNISMNDVQELMQYKIRASKKILLMPKLDPGTNNVGIS
jgi:hypothetical protein